MLKVAICDDNEDFTKRIEEHTEHFSHENNIDVKVSRFISGPQLMLSYFYKKYDIIFLDITMPEMDGFETAERIRKIDSNVVIIFCSSFYNLPNLQKCVQVEAKDFLGKPVLYRKIELILNKVYNKKIINAEEKLMLKTQEGIIALQISDIIYGDEDAILEIFEMYRPLLIKNALVEGIFDEDLYQELTAELLKCIRYFRDVE